MQKKSSAAIQEEKESDDESDSDDSGGLDLSDCSGVMLSDARYYDSPIKRVHVIYYVKQRFEGSVYRLYSCSTPNQRQ